MCKSCPKNNRAYVPILPSYADMAIVWSAKAIRIKAAALYAFGVPRETIERWTGQKSERLAEWLAKIAESDDLWRAFVGRIATLEVTKITDETLDEMRSDLMAVQTDRTLSHTLGVTARLRFKKRSTELQKLWKEIENKKLPDGKTLFPSLERGGVT